MFYYLSELRDYWAPLNIFRYVSFRVVMAMLSALIFSWIVYPRFIRWLKKEDVGQVVRDDGPQTHLKKSGTPTMGGVVIMSAIFVSILFFADLSNHYVWIISFMMLSFAGIGFIDDYLKIHGKNTRGLSGKIRLLAEFTFSAAALLFLFYDPTLNYGGELYFPFISTEKLNVVLPVVLYMLFGAFVVVGTSNAVNLTDGLDGLAITPVTVAASTFLILCYGAGTIIQIPAEVDGTTIYASFNIAQYLHIPHVEGLAELSVVCAAVIGAGIGFLWFNAHPASIFMGDVGSLGLGAALGTLAVLSKNEFLSIIILGLFFVEAVSVITQTTSYKLTGKRVFRMAPIHHHFELKGWAEPKIIVRFWILSILLSLVALTSLKLR